MSPSGHWNAFSHAALCAIAEEQFAADEPDHQHQRQRRRRPGEDLAAGCAATANWRPHHHRVRRRRVCPPRCGVLTVVERRGRHPAGAFDLGVCLSSLNADCGSIFMVPVSSVRTGADPGIVGRDAVAANRESGDSLHIRNRARSSRNRPVRSRAAARPGSLVRRRAGSDPDPPARYRARCDRGRRAGRILLSGRRSRSVDGCRTVEGVLTRGGPLIRVADRRVGPVFITIRRSQILRWQGSGRVPAASSLSPPSSRRHQARQARVPTDNVRTPDEVP